MTTEDFNKENLDQLKEIVNIGASHASTALSQMVKETVMLNVPKAYVGKIEEISSMVEKGSGEKVTATILNIYGDANGIMFFMFVGGSDMKLAKLLTKQENTDGILTELEISALKEVGNILAGACLSAFSKFLDMNMLHSVSEVIIDTSESILNSLASEIGTSADSSLILEVDFSIPGANIDTSLLFFIDPRASEQVLAAVKSKY